MALPPLELFSLERRGRLLPGGLFVLKRRKDRTRRARRKRRLFIEVPNGVLDAHSSWQLIDAVRLVSSPFATKSNSDMDGDASTSSLYLRVLRALRVHSRFSLATYDAVRFCSSNLRLQLNQILV